jgi:hypothetical protein
MRDLEAMGGTIGVTKRGAMGGIIEVATEELWEGP